MPKLPNQRENELNDHTNPTNAYIEPQTQRPSLISLIPTTPLLLAPRLSVLHTGIVRHSWYVDQAGS
jgi:hypothetical protein